MPLHRRGPLVAALALVAGGLAGAPLAAHAAAPPTPLNANASSAGHWLAQQVHQGIVRAYDGFSYDAVRYDLTMDVYLALHDLDTQPATRGAIVTALADQVDDVTTGGFETPDDRHVGATAQLAAVAQAAGRPPTSFGGVDLIKRLEDRVQATGRATDLMAPVDEDDSGEIEPDEVHDESDALSQIRVVRALAAAGSDKTASAVAYLLKQQCSNGEFRLAMDDVACRRATPSDRVSVDATALAITTLVSAGDEVGDVSDVVERAFRYLLLYQRSDGGLSSVGAGGTGYPIGETNTVSTGLAAQAFAAVGRPVQAGAAASFVLRRQSTKASAKGTRLAKELGSIALDDDQRVLGAHNGLGLKSRATWIRSTAPAAVGVNRLLPAKKLTVTVAQPRRKQGAVQLVTVSGLESYEPVRLYMSGQLRVGQALKGGTFRWRLGVGTETGRKVARVYGQRASRVGEAAFTVVR